ncbi:MAG TPA: hypothetical protein VNT42_08815 [Sphingomonas sp.]|nr:hypothetical protein [Sphingomonas sp.]
MRNLSICLAALLISSSVPALARETRQQRGEAELAKELVGLVPGKPERCVTLSRIDGSHIIAGTAIVYRSLGGKTYVNRPLGAERLRDDDIPVQYVQGSQLCRLDRVKLLDRGSRMERGFIGLGDFVPYTKAK